MYSVFKNFSREKYVCGTQITKYNFSMYKSTTDFTHSSLSCSSDDFLFCWLDVLSYKKQGKSQLDLKKYLISDKNTKFPCCFLFVPKKTTNFEQNFNDYATDR